MKVNIPFHFCWKYIEILFILNNNYLKYKITYIFKNGLLEITNYTLNLENNKPCGLYAQRSLKKKKPFLGFNYGWVNCFKLGINTTQLICLHFHKALNDLEMPNDIKVHSWIGWIFFLKKVVRGITLLGNN
jgi:hypothetical protein